MVNVNIAVDCKTFISGFFLEDDNIIIYFRRRCTLHKQRPNNDCGITAAKTLSVSNFFATDECYVIAHSHQRGLNPNNSVINSGPRFWYVTAKNGVKLIYP